MDMLRDVHEFHTHFGLDDAYAKKPSIEKKELMEFRAKFLIEEAHEFADAINEGNIVKAFDALIDIVYVALGTALLMNVPWYSGWMVVHACNMRKKRAVKKEESTRGTTYDVVKPEGWVPPELMLEAKLMEHEFKCKIGEGPICGYIL